MSTAKTAGQRLREDLDAALPPNIVWDQLELVTINRLEVMADRLAELTARVDAMLADPTSSAAALAALANAVRQLEVSMHRLIQTLDPSDSAAGKSMKSRQHQAAALKRWHPGSDYGS